MRVLHVCADTAYGCLAAVSELAIAQTRLGLNVEVVLLRKHGQTVSGFRRQRMESSGVKTHLLPLPRLRSWMRPRIVGRGVGVLIVSFRLLRHTKSVDLVHGHGGLGCACGYLAARYRRIPVVGTRHGLEPGSLHSLVWRWLPPHLDAHVSLLSQSGTSRHVADAALDKPALGNGIDAVAWRESVAVAESLRGKVGIAPGDFVVGVVGRVVDDKQQVFVLRTLASWAADSDDVQILLIGSGPQRSELETSIRGSESCVRFLGFVDDMPAAYRSIDLLVVASLRESQSMVILEAMAAGVPVVATDVGGTPWLLADDAGCLISPLDGQELVRALEELRREPARRRALIRNAERRVEQWFDSSTVAHEYLQQVYHPALARALSARRSRKS